MKEKISYKSIYIKFKNQEKLIHNDKIIVILWKWEGLTLKGHQEAFLGDEYAPSNILPWIVTTVGVNISKCV
jgi:hypothetical protein